MSKRSLLLVAITCHLVLVVCGAAQVNFGGSPLTKPIAYYGAVTGADSGYGFFAPGVGSQLRIDVALFGENGEQIPTLLPAPTNREASLRVGNVVGWFLSEGANPKVRRSLAASWAGKALGKAPSATQAVVKLEQYKLPSSKKYLEGKSGEWVHFYDARFVRPNKKAQSQ